MPSPPSALPRLARGLAIVTGGSRGIGKAIASRFAAEGATVVLAGGRDAQSLESARSSLPVPEVGLGNETAEHVALPGDVGSVAFWEKLEAVVRDVAKPRSRMPASEAGGDILVNAAGISHRSLLMKTAPETVESVLRTNLIGSTMGCRFASNMFARRRKGCIINIASLLAVQGGRGASVYAASKAGIVGLTRALAVEMGNFNVRVNCILPGYIDTQILDDFAEAEKSKLKKHIPLGRFGTAAEVADAALFLATNRYAHNCILNLDGGMSAV